MANVLLDYANWEDTSSLTSPPAWWTGSVYQYIGNISAGLYYYGAQMAYNSGDVNPGDNVAFTALSSSADATSLIVTIDGTQVVNVLLTTGVPYSYDSGALSGGNSIEIDVGDSQFLYSQDLTLTPAGPTAFWQDFVNCAEVN